MGLLSRHDQNQQAQAQWRERTQDKERLQAHDRNRQAAINQGNGSAYTVEYLEKLLDDDHHLDRKTLNLVTVLLNNNWKLSQLKDAEVEEFKWLKRALKKKLHAMHPPEGSPLQGEYRKFIFDDPTDGLSALTQRQRHEIDQLLMTVFAQDTRSRGGWQQEQIGKTTQVSEYRDNKQHESKGLFSFR